MKSKENGTHAKEVAIYFLDKTQDKYTPAIIAKMINQVKNIMSCGYNKEEIISVIDYLIDVKGVKIYSLGYINSAINDTLEVIKKETYNSKVEEMLNKEREVTEEVKVNEDSNQRNREKSERFGTNTRFGEKHNFDMLEGHGKD